MWFLILNNCYSLSSNKPKCSVKGIWILSFNKASTFSSRPDITGVIVSFKLSMSYNFLNIESFLSKPVYISLWIEN